MAWLGDWLREIILIVLLAAFVEMLLPSKSMERYARLVLSLLVLLTMLSPIVSFLKGDAVTELSLAMDQQKNQEGMWTNTGQDTYSLEEILAEGQKLANGQQEQGLKLAANEIAGQMKDQISTETGKRGVQVTVAMTMKKQATPEGDALPAISMVTVIMPKDKAISEATNASGNGEALSGPIVIPPVPKVEVNIDIGSREARTSGEDAPNNMVSVEEVEAIIALLEQKWGIEPEVIKVQSSVSEAAKL